MSEKNKSFSNKKQLEKLVELMEKSPNIAKCIYKKSEAVTYWKKFASELNSLGPPIKTAEKWAKVWTDLKFKVKKKLIENKNEIRATGGGPHKIHQFCPLEESIIHLLSLDKCTNPMGREFGLNITNNLADVTEADLPKANISTGDVSDKSNVSEMNIPVQLIEEEENNFSACEEFGRNEAQSGISQTISNIKKKRIFTKEEKCTRFVEYMENSESLNNEVKLEIKKLKEDIGEMKEHIKGLAEYTRKTYYVQKDILKLKEEELRLSKEQFKYKQRSCNEKLKLKLELLELKKKQFDLKIAI